LLLPYTYNQTQANLYIQYNVPVPGEPPPHPLSDLLYLDSHDPRRRNLRRRLYIRRALLRNEPGRAEDTGNKGILEAGMAYMASLPQVRPDRNLGKVADGAHNLYNLLFLYRPPEEGYGLRRQAHYLLLPPRHGKCNRRYISRLNLISLLRLIVLSGIISDIVRNQVIRYNPFTGVFNSIYINYTVWFNI
jgi:hypothetical protein